jgi:cyanophycinase
MLRFQRLLLSVLWLGIVLPCPAQAPAYRYFRLGNASPFKGTPHPGFALMGGGTDLDEAFRWLCGRAGGGDLLVLRATGDDDYNPYIQKLCHVNSVATLLIPNRTAAADPAVAKIIDQAAALFLSGGDQANYINFWMGTPVQLALNEAIRRGVPIGGTSAGLAVLGEYAYSAQGDKPNDPNLDGKRALDHPFGPRVTLVHRFLGIPILNGIITDTHFATRDRMGRLLVFLARLNQADSAVTRTDGRPVRGIGVEQGTAVMLESDGRATVVGHGSAYFVDPVATEPSFSAGKPLSIGAVRVQKVRPGHTFNVKSWSGEAVRYSLSVSGGTIHSTQPGGSVY